MEGGTKRCELGEWLFTKCLECRYIVRFQSSKKYENHFLKINIQSLNARIISGNTISNMPKIYQNLLHLPGLIIFLKI